MTKGIENVNLQKYYQDTYSKFERTWGNAEKQILPEYTETCYRTPNVEPQVASKKFTTSTDQMRANTTFDKFMSNSFIWK